MGRLRSVSLGAEATAELEPSRSEGARSLPLTVGCEKIEYSTGLASEVATFSVPPGGQVSVGAVRVWVCVSGAEACSRGRGERL